MSSMPRGRRALRNCILFAAGICLLASTGCGGGSGSSSPSGISTGTGTTGTTPNTVNNTLPLQVGLGPTGNDVNQLLATITICVSGTSNCQSIPNVLVDTGSTGLRLLASAVTLALPQVSDSSGNPLGNCAQFSDNSYAWGPVATADIQLAGEIASKAPIQLIGATGFPAVPASCNTGGAAANTVAELGAYGILGIGVFPQDCGSPCASSGSELPTVYYGCPSSGCVPEAVAVGQQLQNPVVMFPQDNNGTVISLPALSPSGGEGIAGSLIFGIGTQSNNALSGVQVYTTDSNGNFSVTYNGVNYSNSFVDSGSNGFFYLDAPTLGIPTCSDSPDFYCPVATVNATAITTGTNGTSSTIAITVANADQLFATTNNAFDDLGGPGPGQIDLGLPFFFGRYVYTAIQGQSTTSGTGPYWAY